MLWKIVSFLLSVFVLVVILNLIFGFVQIAPIGQIISAVIAIGLIILLLRMIRAAV